MTSRELFIQSPLMNLQRLIDEFNPAEVILDRDETIALKRNFTFANWQEIIKNGYNGVKITCQNNVDAKGILDLTGDEPVLKYLNESQR